MKEIKLLIVLFLLLLSACTQQAIKTQEEPNILKECVVWAESMGNLDGRFASVFGLCQTNADCLKQIEKVKSETFSLGEDSVICKETTFSRMKTSEGIYVSCSTKTDCEDQLGLLVSFDESDESISDEDKEELLFMMEGTKELVRCQKNFCEITTGLKNRLDYMEGITLAISEMNP